MAEKCCTGVIMQLMSAKQESHLSQTGQMKVALLATISTLRGEGKVPLGPLYLPLMNRMSLHDFQRLINTMVSGGIAKVEGFMIELTPLGTEMATAIDEKVKEIA